MKVHLEDAGTSCMLQPVKQQCIDFICHVLPDAYREYLSVPQGRHSILDSF
jgi:hypothetical protein